MIHVASPYSLTKDLGAAYNSFMKLIPEGDWVILHDHDVMFLLPETIQMIDEYTKKFPDTGIFTCWTNRIGNPHQRVALLNDTNDSILRHIEIAEEHKELLFQCSEINQEISGFLMVVNKSTWNEIKFHEGIKCLGVDTDFSLKVLASGRKILRMDSVYVWHTYRLKNGVKFKAHLK